MKIFGRAPYPLHVQVEPTNTCNLQCPLCVTGTKSSKRKKTFMSFNLFNKIVDEISGKVNYLSLNGYGEPFINPDIIKMLSYASQKGVNTYVNTNGHFIDSFEKAKKVVKSGIYNIQIALDAVDQKTYEKYRVGGDFNKVLSSIKYLVQAKKELKSNTPEIALLYLVMKHNEKDRKKAEKLSKKLGADVFHEKTIAIHDHKKKGFLNIVKKFLPKDKSMRRYYDIIDEINFNGKIFNYCPRIYRSFIINSEGDVLPCSCDNKDIYVLGNLNKQSIKHIWNGRKFRKFRKNVLKNQKNIDLCQECPYARNLEGKNRIVGNWKKIKS